MWHRDPGEQNLLEKVLLFVALPETFDFLKCDIYKA